LLKPVVFVPSVHSKVLFGYEEDPGEELVRDQEEDESEEEEEEWEEQEGEEQEEQEEREEEEEEDVEVGMPLDSKVEELALNPGTHSTLSIYLSIYSSCLPATEVKIELITAN
jgi:hypothetical protein